MAKLTKWILPTIILCCMGVLYSCNGNGCDLDAEVKSTELLRTSQSWNGIELPDYPQGRPELVAVKYMVPPGEKLGWHHHVAMNHGVLVQGELTIIGLDGQTKVVREGEIVVEMVDAIHHGGQCPKYCVNEKTGFRYYLLYLDSVFKYKNKLVHNQAPIMNRLCPFLLNFHQ